jgi:alpha-beta hydrolase superfamily lysophospholipase
MLARVRWFPAFAIIVALAGASCAGPSYVSGQRPELRVAPDIVHTETHFAGYEGLRLFAESWRPRKQRIRGVLAIVHGLKDHADRYNDFATFLARHGYAVYAMDLRGHGDSEGDRVYLGSFDDYLEDLKAFIGVVQCEYEQGGKPLFLMGHSMGGAIVTLYALRNQPRISGLVLSAPALKRPDDVPGIKVFFTNIFGFMAPRLALFSLPNEDFSRDPQVVAAMGSDPLIYQGAAPVKTAKALLGAMSDIDDSMEKLNVPVLLLHGTKDKLTNPDGSRDLNRRAASKDKSLKIYDGYYHDLLHEPEHAKVAEDIRAWLDARTR